MRFIRFTIRRQKVAVAIVALMVVLCIQVGLARRRWYYLALADRHQGDAMRLRLEAREIYTCVRDDGRLGVAAGEEIRLAREKSALHSVLAAKYRRAARYPWLPVEPDPAGSE